MQPTPLQAETDAPARGVSLIDLSLGNSFPSMNLVGEQGLTDLNFEDFINLSPNYNDEHPSLASNEESSNGSISQLTPPSKQGLGWDDSDDIPRLDPQNLPPDGIPPFCTMVPDAHVTEMPAIASFPMLSPQPPYSHTSNFIAGYLACLEDQASVAESLLSANHLPMHPTGPIHNNWCEMHGETPPVQIPVLIPSPGSAESHLQDQSALFQVKDSLPSFKKPSKLRSPSNALAKIDTSMGASQFSIHIPPTLATQGKQTNSNPIQFIHTSVSTGPDGRTVLPRTSSKRSLDSETQVPRKRTIIRKKGAACGLCGERKVKVGHAFLGP